MSDEQSIEKTALLEFFEGLIDDDGQKTVLEKLLFDDVDSERVVKEVIKYKEQDVE